MEIPSKTVTRELNTLTCLDSAHVYSGSDAAISSSEGTGLASASLGYTATSELPFPYLL